MTYHRSLHLLALLTTAATFPLIFMGGLVTSHQAGMSVPDWPNSYGYNMFLFPPNQWVGGILYEHTHRLMGTVVGFCAISLALCAWAPARHAGLRWWIGRIGAVTLTLAILTADVWIAAQKHWIDRWMDGSMVLKWAPHLLVGWAAIALVCGVAFFCRRREERRWVRWFVLGVLAAVIAQGVFGGLRVTAVDRRLAIVHACFAQAFFCMAAFAAVATSRWWTCRIRRADPSDDSHQARRVGRADHIDRSRDVAVSGEAVRTADPRDPRGEAVLHDSVRTADPTTLRATGERSGAVASPRGLLALAVLAVVVIYLQLIIGAMMRHYDAGLAIPDLPLAYGRMLPPTDAAGLDAANAVRAADHGSPALLPVSLTQVWLHFGHRIGALLVTIALAAVIVAVLRRHRAHGALVRPALLLIVLLLTQLTLGVLTVLWRKPADLASAHVAVGALTLLTTFVLAARAGRIVSISGFAKLGGAQAEDRPHGLEARVTTGATRDTGLQPVLTMRQSQ